MKNFFDKIFLRKRYIFLFSLCITVTIGIAFIIYFACIQNYYKFENDDIILKRIVEGVVNGENSPHAPTPNMVFSNYVYGLILSLFYLIFPYAPWYFIFLLLITIFAYTAILYKIMLLCNTCYKKRIVGLIIFAILIFTCNYAIRINYTYTAGLCAGAAILYCICIDFDNSKKELIFDTIILSLLTGFSILVRNEIGYITFVFIVAIFIYKFVFEKVDIKKLYKIAVPVLCCLIVPFCVQKIADNSAYYREHTKYNYLRSQIFDIYGMPEWETSKEFYESIGMDYDAYVLANTVTYIFDDVMNVEQMQSIVDYQIENKAEKTFFGKIKATVDTMFSTPRDITFTRSSYIIIAFTAAFIVLMIMRKEYARLILLLMISLLSLMMYVYLCYGGRVPDRSIRPLFFIELLTIIYFVFTENLDFLFKFKKQWIGYAITAGLILFILPGTAINFLEDRGAYKVNRQLYYNETHEIREYIINNNEHNYIVEYRHISSEPIIFNNNSLPRMNFVAKSGWDMGNPNNEKLYKAWGIDGKMQIDKICDKDIAFLCRKGTNCQEAFVSFVGNHYPTMQVIETDVITTNTGEEIGVYKVVSK